MRYSALEPCEMSIFVQGSVGYRRRCLPEVGNLPYRQPTFCEQPTLCFANHKKNAAFRQERFLSFHL